MPTAFMQVVNWAINDMADGSAYASSASIADISPTPQWFTPVNGLTAGMVIRISASGVFSNTATPTLIIGAYYGAVAGTALAASTTVTTITAATNWSWAYEYEGEVRSVGTSGTIMGAGRLLMPASLTQFQAPYACPATAPAAVTIDTTTTKAITMGATWSASSPSNTLTLKKFIIEIGTPL